MRGTPSSDRGKNEAEEDKRKAENNVSLIGMMMNIGLQQVEGGSKTTSRMTKLDEGTSRVRQRQIEEDSLNTFTTLSAEAISL